MKTITKNSNGRVTITDNQGNTYASLAPSINVVKDNQQPNDYVVFRSAFTVVGTPNDYKLKLSDIDLVNCSPPITATNTSELIDQLNENFFFEISKGYKYNVDTYADLQASLSPAPQEGDIAFVKNSQGTKWLPGSLGGNYYPVGAYIYISGSWVSEKRVINEELAKLNGYGTYRQYAESLPITTSLQTTPITKVELTTINLPAATYNIFVDYGFNRNSTNSDFIAEVLLNGSILRNIHRIEFKDSSGAFGATGSAQRDYKHRPFKNIGLSGINTITLQFYGESGNINSSMWDASIEVIKSSN